jgi:4-diphosphocytidyl-2-C-methyl-D-erythritol kinase
MEVFAGRFASPAKINFGLRILGKRPDGYHTIETILQMIDLCDWLSFRANDVGSIALTCSPPTLPTDERNLIMRAAKSLQQARHASQGIAITLEKRIPIAAGLGGGSSNAATALLALNHVWGLNCPAPVLHHLAAQLGSDVPFFLNGPTALAAGRGDVLSPISSPPPLTGVLVNPGFGISAGWAYGQFSGRSLATDETMAIILRALQDQNLRLLGDVTVNDLDPGVAAAYPVIREMQAVLRAVGAVAIFLSGSGPTICGVFSHAASVQQAVARLARRPEWLIIPFTTLSKSPHTERQG